jgi:hypothetical protein
MAKLSIKQTATALVSANTEAAKLSAKITIGNTLNDRVAAMVVPKLPLMVRAMAQSNEDVTKVILANLTSAAIMQIAPQNAKAILAADAMINSAMLKFVGSFNIEAIINEAIDGLDLSILGDTELTFDQD